MGSDSAMIYDRERSEGYETLRRASPAIVQVLAAAMGAGVPGGAMRVLDAGCGSGNYLYEFAGRAHLGLRLLGLDISPDMLEHARRKTTGFRVGLACADLERLPLAAGAFDAVYMVHALHHLGGDPELPPPRREKKKTRGAGGTAPRSICRRQAVHCSERSMAKPGQLPLEPLFSPGAGKKALPAARVGAGRRMVAGCGVCGRRGPCLRGLAHAPRVQSAIRLG